MQYINVLKKSFLYIFILTILIVTTMLIYQSKINKKKEHNILMGNFLLDAENIKNNSNLEKKLLQYVINNSKSHVADIAALKFAIKNDKNSSIKELQKIINDNNYYYITQNYAKLILISILLEEDNLTFEQQSLINTYTNCNDEKEMLFGTINLLKSIWLIKQNKIDLAFKTLQKIINSNFVGIEIKNYAKIIVNNIIINKQ